jgi:hypothetical protein
MYATVLMNNSIPVYFKVMIMRSIVIPSIMYGAELWGWTGHIWRRHRR